LNPTGLVKYESRWHEDLSKLSVGLTSRDV
jgi:hypothetical protein